MGGPWEGKPEDGVGVGGGPNTRFVPERRYRSVHDQGTDFTRRAVVGVPSRVHPEKTFSWNNSPERSSEILSVETEEIETERN